MASLFQYGKYGAINRADTNINGFYVIMFITEAYTLQNNTAIDGKFMSVGELVIKAQYIFFMKENTNWYWKQQPLQHNIMVPTRTILHPRPDVSVISHVQYTP